MCYDDFCNRCNPCNSCGGCSSNNTNRAYYLIGPRGPQGPQGEQGETGATGPQGEQGEKGEAGVTPVIGVAKDTDGVYYWTLNGSWLVDESGSKIPTTGKDGDDGDQVCKRGKCVED